jgi:hypothetical protein
MFWSATKFSQAIGNWNVSSVTGMSYMFYQSTSFNQDLCAWYNNLQSGTAVLDIFVYSGCTNQADPNFLTKSSFCQACTCSRGK